jgi:hypothetical protein
MEAGIQFQGPQEASAELRVQQITSALFVRHSLFLSFAAVRVIYIAHRRGRMDGGSAVAQGQQQFLNAFIAERESAPD